MSRSPENHEAKKTALLPLAKQFRDFLITSGTLLTLTMVPAHLAHAATQNVLQGNCPSNTHHIATRLDNRGKKAGQSDEQCVDLEELDVVSDGSEEYPDFLAAIFPHTDPHHHEHGHHQLATSIYAGLNSASAVRGHDVPGHGSFGAQFDIPFQSTPIDIAFGASGEAIVFGEETEFRGKAMLHGHFELAANPLAADKLNWAVGAESRPVPGQNGGDVFVNANLDLHPKEDVLLRVGTHAGYNGRDYILEPRATVASRLPEPLGQRPFSLSTGLDFGTAKHMEHHAATYETAISERDEQTEFAAAAQHFENHLNGKETGKTFELEQVEIVKATVRLACEKALQVYTSAGVHYLPASDEFGATANVFLRASNKTCSDEVEEEE